MPRRRTRTSRFGTSGRETHDARPFYRSRLYHDVPLPPREQPYHENPLPPHLVNRVLVASAEDMRALPDASVHLMVTSPPYNVGKEYDANLTLAEYRAFLRRVWAEVYRVLVPGGRACINIANLGRKPYLPLHAYLIEDMLALGFWMRGEIVWDKDASAGVSTAWGTWRSPANPTLRDVHEYILVFSKGPARRRAPSPRLASLSREEFLTFTKSVWRFPSVSARRIGHPAPFPEELPYRCIQLYTFVGEVVLDPFMGSGQTALAAVRAGRRFVGYEIVPQYAQLAHQRVQARLQAWWDQARSSPAPPAAARLNPSSRRHP